MRATLGFAMTNKCWFEFPRYTAELSRIACLRPTTAQGLRNYVLCLGNWGSVSFLLHAAFHKEKALSAPIRALQILRLQLGLSSYVACS